MVALLLIQERWKNKMKVIIVGGVAGGATAAARIRRLDEHAEITVFERSGYISYANCGLPYYIGDVITDPEELTLQTPESFFKRFRINMKIHHEVISIHPERKTVSVKNLENDEIFEENYDKLILSPGAKPTQPRLPGVGIDKLFTLRTVEDTFRIKEYINKNHPKSAVLAGGGFIGLELAENLRELGMDVTIVQRPKQLMNPFDPDMASMIHNEMRKYGIKLVLGYTVEGFKEKDNGVEVLLKDNPSLQADMVVLAIGVTPDTALAKEAGLELGIKGSIVVNDRMETSVPDIYAAGDAVQVKHYVTMFGNMVFQTYLVGAGSSSLREAIKLFWTFRVPWGWTYTAGTVADWVAQFSFGFYSLMLTSLLLGLIVMVLYKPRTWCTFCPMGTMTQGICKLKNNEKK